MLVTEVKCDRCGERISEGQPYHTIQWREITQGIDLINHGEPSMADLCEGCYDTVIKQDLAQYGYKSELDLSLFDLRKGCQNEKLG